MKWSTRLKLWWHGRHCRKGGRCKWEYMPLVNLAAYGARQVGSAYVCQRCGRRVERWD